MIERRMSTGLVAAAMALGFAATARAQAPVVMATGLDNPRGLAVGPGGYVYVVEAGTGGNSALCLPNTGGAPGTRCYGPSGAVTQILAPGVQQRVLTGLPSIAVPGGAEAIGPHAIDFGFDRAFITVGSGGDPASLAPFRAQGIDFGRLLMVSYTGVITPIVDVSGYEAINNPAGGPFDSNAFGLDILSNRGVLTDAGGNSLLQVDVGLNVTTLATFPSRDVPAPGGAGGTVPMESVPTSVVEGPDGYLYVGELTGFPFVAGAARVYRVPPTGGTPQIVAEGFTNIIGLAIGPDGAAYVLEHDANSLIVAGDVGRLTKIGPFGLRTELAAGLLISPGGLTVGPDNAVYVSVNSKTAGNGQVLKIAQ